MILTSEAGYGRVAEQLVNPTKQSNRFILPVGFLYLSNPLCKLELIREYKFAL